MTAVVDRRSQPIRRKQGRSERFLPFVQLGLALAIVVLVLPSVLRPPQTQPTTSGAFSPDAPPDPKQQSVFASFNASSSGVAAGTDPPRPPAARSLPVIAAPPTVPAPKVVARACPYGFGNPLRQVESLYAPACAPAFKGNNGGATSFGVTPTEIRVCFSMALTGATDNGEIPVPPPIGASAVLRTYSVLAQYFNSRLQLYGRQLRFFYSASDGSRPSGTTNPFAAGSGPEDQRARSQQCKHSFKTFAAIQETEPAGMDELARLGISTFTLAHTPEDWFAARDPYLWSFAPTADRTIQIGSEYACKKLVGRPPIYTGEDQTVPISHAKPRAWGILTYDVPQLNGWSPKIKQAFDACGADVRASIVYNLDGGSSGSEGLSTAMTRFKAAGVTTIAYYGELLSAPVFTQAATTNGYFPEWFVPSFGGVDTGTIARLYDQQQWKHAFGISFYEIPRVEEETECHRAYHEIDPSSEPDAGMCTYMWGPMIQLFGGMQQAGPNLTPATLKAAFLKQPPLKPVVPYTMAGGYSATDHTFPDYVAEMWWDPEGIGSDGQAGAYRYPNNGRRYTYGQFNNDPPTYLFKEGITLARAVA